MREIPATYLDKANVKRLLTKALTADVQPVFPDQTGLVCADAAVLLSLGFQYQRPFTIKKDPLWQ